MKTSIEIFNKHFSEIEDETEFLELKTKPYLREEVLAAITEALEREETTHTIHQFSEDNIFISDTGKLIVFDSGSAKIFIEAHNVSKVIKKLTKIQDERYKQFETERDENEN